MNIYIYIWIFGGHDQLFMEKGVWMLIWISWHGLAHDVKLKKSIWIYWGRSMPLFFFPKRKALLSILIDEENPKMWVLSDRSIRFESNDSSLITCVDRRMQTWKIKYHESMILYEFYSDYSPDIMKVSNPHCSISLITRGDRHMRSEDVIFGSPLTIECVNEWDETNVMIIKFNVHDFMKLCKSSMDCSDIQKFTYIYIYYIINPCGLK